ncbi:hypothetical protein PIB30_061844 [Stylosanthes scabra]|uniref:Uncharacterized protein n=1 Tax=Stylosanthes scabra TaxID=79078 RepID=A0ABU6TLK5_9FABA|nr:hypothetical protein [Stylosanthes scabra]
MLLKPHRLGNNTLSLYKNAKFSDDVSLVIEPVQMFGFLRGLSDLSDWCRFIRLSGLRFSSCGSSRTSPGSHIKQKPLKQIWGA